MISDAQFAVELRKVADYLDSERAAVDVETIDVKSAKHKPI